ncbi:DUF924 family protein [Thiosocius teredinicola]|uniref:DUF924 family protein n=1 Tax=Thiosocius teredinicola TaxID=1973002 RepID=UPI000991434F
MSSLDQGIEANDVIDFWFAPTIRKAWFRSTPEIDQEIRQRFEQIWQAAGQGRCSDWLNDANGCLAFVIVCDQFPLNMYRGTAKSFSTETLAVAASRRAVDTGLDQALPDEHKAFLYMPLMHSERIEHQQRAVELFDAAGLSDNLRFAKHHRELIERFGRFPHRNAILGRRSTPEERAYLQSKEAFTG